MSATTPSEYSLLRLKEKVCTLEPCHIPLYGSSHTQTFEHALIFHPPTTPLDIRLWFGARFLSFSLLWECGRFLFLLYSSELGFHSAQGLCLVASFTAGPRVAFLLFILYLQRWPLLLFLWRMQLSPVDVSFQLRAALSSSLAWCFRFWHPPLLDHVWCCYGFTLLLYSLNLALQWGMLFHAPGALAFTLP